MFGAVWKLGLGCRSHARHLAGSLSAVLGLVNGKEPGRLKAALRLPDPDTGGQAVLESQAMTSTLYSWRNSSGFCRSTFLLLSP